MSDKSTGGAAVAGSIILVLVSLACFGYAAYRTFFLDKELEPALIIAGLVGMTVAVIVRKVS